MNCNNTNLIAWPEGNSVLLRVQVRQPQRDEHGEVVRDQDGNVVYIPLPLDGMDGWAASIVRRPANTVYMVETALDTDDPSVVVMSVPSTQPQGEYSVELTVSKSGANGRSIEVPAFRVVDRNDKANELFTVVNGSRTTDIVLSFSVVPSATTQGKSAYEEWKELPGNENKTLQDYINEVLDLYGITSRAAAATVHAEGAATGAERVNATLSGTMLTVTSRDGQSTSVDTKGPKGDPGTTDYNDLRNRPVIMMATGGLKTSNADESTNSQSIAIGDSASNQGSNSVAIGYHAENRDSPDGRQVYSPSGRQVSIGNHVMATLPNEVVLGNYNVPNGSLFSIGIGTNENNRANLFQISSTGVVSVRRDSAMKTLALTEDLANYYTKNETYTQVQVDQLLQAQLNGEFVTADALPTASESTMCKIYLVPSTNPVVGNVFDEYITLKTEDPQQPGTYFYEWEQIGSTAIDLSGYVTTTALNTALADYTTTANLTTLLAGKQDKIDSSHKLSADLVDDTNTTNKFTNATEKQTWNGKQDALVSGTNIKTINNESVLGSGNISVAAELPSNLAYTSNDNGEGIIPSDGIRAVTVTNAATMTINPDVVTVIDGAVGTAAITLQVPQDNLAHVWDILMTTDSTVAITFAMSNSATILTPSGFSIGASKAVEISVIGVGTKYYLRYGEFA